MTTWEDALRSAGLRVTRPRLLVAEALAELEGHHGADDILSHLAERGTPLPRASVYNVLDALVEVGIVTPAFHGPGRALYEIADDPHDHFLCTACDELVDVPREQKPPKAGIADVVVEEVAVVYRGLCPCCVA